MKRAMILVAVVALVGILLPGAADASGSDWQTITGLPCGGSGALVGLEGDLYTEDSTWWLNTADGELFVTCRFDLPEEQRPDNVLVRRNFDCGWAETWESFFWASPKGRAVAYCHGRAW